MRIRLLSIAITLLIGTSRLPAPIQEVQETPTPAPQLQLTPPASTTPERADPARFAGTWTGRIKIGKAGEVDVTLVVNSEATSLTQTSKRFGKLVHPTTVTGRTLSWIAGLTNEVAWTLTPNPDGQTALATTKAGTGVENTAIFQRAPSRR